MSKVNLQRRDTELQAEAAGLPLAIVEPTLVTYRSVGIGIFGVVMRFSGMPLEKMALFMNSSQVSGKNQVAQSLRLTFKEGALAPYRVVGPASLVAWFLQYSIMGFAFQFFDHSISNMLGVKPVYYGSELMSPAPPKDENADTAYFMKSAVARLLSPVLAAFLETKVSNRAEVQRYYGPEKLAKVERQLGLSPLARAAGPAFMPNVMRNVIMCHTTFLITPITYKLYFPQEKKSKSSLFWYGLGMNMFVGNVMAITQQALWGRTLDFAAKEGRIHYGSIVRQGFQKDGLAAFITGPKWFSRVLMNAPAQGVLPWFYNEVLPIGEPTVLAVVKNVLYDPLLKQSHEVRQHRIARQLTTSSRTSAESLAELPSKR
jgi:hypothetical protein